MFTNEQSFCLHSFWWRLFCIPWRCFTCTSQWSWLVSLLVLSLSGNFRYICFFSIIIFALFDANSCSFKRSYLFFTEWRLRAIFPHNSCFKVHLSGLIANLKWRRFGHLFWTYFKCLPFHSGHTLGDFICRKGDWLRLTAILDSIIKATITL